MTASACGYAGIKDLHFHDLRHTAASKMVEAGVDLVTVKEILGHSSIEMTIRYAHPTSENKRRAVEKLEQIFAEADSQNVVSPQQEVPLDKSSHSVYN